MDLKQSIQAQLESDLSCDVYQERLPAGVTLPVASWQKISHIPLHSHDGYSGLSSVRIQVDLWAESEADRETLLGELRAGFDCFKGDLGGAGGVWCGHIIMANAIDSRDPDTDWLRCSVDFVLAVND